jgi:hypothetical protein
MERVVLTSARGEVILSHTGKSFKLNLGVVCIGYLSLSNAALAPAPAPALDDSSLQRHQQFHVLITSPSSSSSSAQQ